MVNKSDCTATVQPQGISGWGDGQTEVSLKVTRPSRLDKPIKKTSYLSFVDFFHGNKFPLFRGIPSLKQEVNPKW